MEEGVEEGKVEFYIPAKLATWLRDTHNHPWLREHLRNSPRVIRGRGHSILLTMTQGETRSLIDIIESDMASMRAGEITSADVGMRRTKVAGISKRIAQALS